MGQVGGLGSRDPQRSSRGRAGRQAQKDRLTGSGRATSPWACRLQPGEPGPSSEPWSEPGTGEGDTPAPHFLLRTLEG